MAEYVLLDGTDEERALPFSGRRERMAERILAAMAGAGLTAFERDVYWMHVGCVESFSDVAALLTPRARRNEAKQSAYRAFLSAEYKLSVWVSTEGYSASPLYRRAQATVSASQGGVGSALLRELQSVTRRRSAVRPLMGAAAGPPSA